MPYPELPVIYPHFETPRLIIKELTLEDTEAVFHLFADPNVVELMDIEPLQSLAEAEEVIQFHINDIGTRWGLFHKQDNTMIGTYGFHCWNLNEPTSIEIGYDLAKAYWGQRLMTEAIHPVIDFGFDELMVSKIEATPHKNNQRSIVLLERLGFNREKELRDDHYDYFVMKAQWARK